MNLKKKREILAFLQAHNDGSKETLELIQFMKRESDYADCDTHSVSREDLNALGERSKTKLRYALGKKANEPFIVEDCVTVANWLCDSLAEDFGEDLHNVIEVHQYR